MARHVLITGASRGLGRATADRLAAGGWSVWAGLRNPTTPPPGAARAIPLDVRDLDSIRRGIDELLGRTGGRLDAVVVNAGIFAGGAFEDTPAEVTRAIMETNFIGAVETVRAALPALRASHGRIVLMSSDSGLCGTPGLCAYTASKFALEGWGESLAYEVGPLGVSVSLVEPGAFRTDIWSSPVHRRPDGPYAAFGEILERELQAIGANASDPDRVAKAVVKALDAKRPRLRYPVGSDARRVGILKRVLSDRAFMRTMRRATRLGRWRPAPGAQSR